MQQSFTKKRKIEFEHYSKQLRGEEDTEYKDSSRYHTHLGTDVKWVMPANIDNRACFGTHLICGDPDWGKSTIAKNVFVKMFHHRDFWDFHKGGYRDHLFCVEGLNKEWENNITRPNFDSTDIDKESEFIPKALIDVVYDPVLYFSHCNKSLYWEMFGCTPPFARFMERLVIKGYNYHFDDLYYIDEMIGLLERNQNGFSKEFPGIQQSHMAESTIRAGRERWDKIRSIGIVDQPKAHDEDRAVIDDYFWHFINSNKRVHLIQSNLRTTKSKAIVFKMFNDFYSNWRLERLRPIIFMEEADHMLPHSFMDKGDTGEVTMEFQSALATDFVIKRRKPGIAFVCINQYPSRLNKDLLKPAHQIISGPLKEVEDRKAVWPDADFPSLAYDLNRGLRIFAYYNRRDNFKTIFIPKVSCCAVDQPTTLFKKYAG